MAGGVEFCLGIYKIIGKYLFAVVEESRQKGVVLPTINLMFISYFPKKDAPESSNYLRPISLCNVVYKFIAKIIASNLKTIL